MENEYLSPRNLKPISDLLRKRELKINSLINSLRIDDVRLESAFENSTTRIKGEVLIAKVVFGEGTFIDHNYEDIPLTFNQQVSGMMSRHHFYHEIRFAFSGDDELFTHTPDSWSFSSSDRGIIPPDHGVIDVIVDLPALNPDAAIVKAKTLLGMNIQFVTSNNQRVETWNKQVEELIDDQLGRKRAELVRLFGNK